MRFPVNLTALAMRMMDVISTITLLQEMGILPLGIACNTCSTNLGPYTTNHNYHYFECNSCKTNTIQFCNASLGILVMIEVVGKVMDVIE